MAPGPNNLMAMSNAKRYGLKTACYAGSGRLFAFLIMISLAGSGLASVLYASQSVFLVIKLLGAFYLFWLAYQLWTANPVADVEQQTAKLSVYELAKQEFLLAIGNPKAILIFTAFLPQFVDTSHNVAFQFIVLGVLFLLLEWVAIAIYGCFGVYLRQWFAKPSMRQLFNRGCASLMGAAGLGLLVART
jgi:threonine/homoserine/homoserine lactone efflux protein